MNLSLSFYPNLCFSFYILLRLEPDAKVQIVCVHTKVFLVFVFVWMFFLMNINYFFVFFS